VDPRAVTITFEEADNLWRIYWSGTKDLADERWFPTLESAGPAARVLVFPPAEGASEA